LKPTLITGASGFLGWHVAQKLIGRGHTVRALVRPTSTLRELEVERVVGDLRDPESLERAATGCGAVFHVAADYRLWARDSGDIYRSNVEGTRNTLAAARKAGVDRFVYTSTVGCIGFPEGHPGNETTPVGIEDMCGAYKRSKFMAEQVALEFAGSGFPVVIVNPTAPVGDHDFKPTPTGRIIVDFVQARMPAFLDTGLNVVDADDVAEGHVRAYESGRNGERYLLGGQNMTLQAVFQHLAIISGMRAPRIRIPYGVAFAAGVASTGWAYWTGKDPRAPLDGVRMARKKMWISSDKARNELGYTPGQAEVGLRKAVDWFRANGYC
jgi:dihydroflavonol-4-reductase